MGGDVRIAVIVDVVAVAVRDDDQSASIRAKCEFPADGYGPNWNLDRETVGESRMGRCKHNVPELNDS
jgi:hypothetical protein